MSTLPDSSEITPGQCSFWSLNITVNSILPAGNESFLLCVWNHSAPIFLLFELQTVCGLGIHLTLRLSLSLKTLLVKSWEPQGQEPERKKEGRLLSCRQQQNQTGSARRICSEGSEGSNSAISVSSSRDLGGLKPAETKWQVWKYSDLPVLWLPWEAFQSSPAGSWQSNYPFQTVADVQASSTNPFHQLDVFP